VAAPVVKEAVQSANELAEDFFGRAAYLTGIYICIYICVCIQMCIVGAGRQGDRSIGERAGRRFLGPCGLPNRCIYVYIYIYIYVCVCVYVCMYICIQRYRYMYRYRYRYMYTYIYKGGEQERERAAPSANTLAEDFSAVPPT